MSQIEESLSAKIATVNTKIDKVEEDITEAKGHVLDNDNKEFWEPKLQQLREEEKQLWDKKKQLLEEKLRDIVEKNKQRTGKYVFLSPPPPHSPSRLSIRPLLLSVK